MYFFSVLLLNDNMKMIEQIRTENLKALIKATGDGAFAERTGKSPAQVSQWKNNSID